MEQLWDNFGNEDSRRTERVQKVSVGRWVDSFELCRYFDNAIEENGEESKVLENLAAKNNIHVVIGVVEREASTLYCSVFFYSPERYLGKHRKLLPTALERCVWGQGDGSTMPVFETSVGKIGTAICWENYMPLYRMTLYNKGSLSFSAPEDVNLFRNPNLPGSDCRRPRCLAINDADNCPGRPMLCLFVLPVPEEFRLSRRPPTSEGIR